MAMVGVPNPSVGCPFMFSKKYVSNVSWPNMISSCKASSGRWKGCLKFLADWIRNDCNIQLS